MAYVRIRSTPEVYHVRPKEEAIGSQAYQDAGVNIDAGAALVDAIRPLAQATMRRGVVTDLGGFGAVFDPAAAGHGGSLLVAATDGVGTKLKVAVAAGRHDTVGIDLVAMCVNDIVVVGAEPLFFLDYFATGQLDVDTAAAVVRGIAEGCRQAGCALIGGETAEMPGHYAADDYDLAGFAVGAVARDRVVNGDGVRPGDIVLGLASSGLHSNGFSLVRRIVQTADLAYASPAPFDPSRRLGDALLAPTRIYVSACLAAAKSGLVRAMAHITGGGLMENIPRVIPQGLAVRLDTTAWRLPPVFRWLRNTGRLTDDDLARTFNCGIGMAVIVAPAHADAAVAAMTKAGEEVHRIGMVMPRASNEASVELTGMERAWRD